MDPTTFRMICGSEGFPPAQILSFVSDNYTLYLSLYNPPLTFTLTWNVLNAASVTIDQNIGSVASSGSRSITRNIPGLITYTLTAVDLNNTTHTAAVQINIICPSCSLNDRRYNRCPSGC